MNKCLNILNTSAAIFVSTFQAVEELLFSDEANSTKWHTYLADYFQYHCSNDNYTIDDLPHNLYNAGLWERWEIFYYQQRPGLFGRWILTFVASHYTMLHCYSLEGFSRFQLYACSCRRHQFLPTLRLRPHIPQMSSLNKLRLRPHILPMGVPKWCL